MEGNTMYFAVDNSDVEAGVNNLGAVFSKLWAGFEAVLDITPPIVLGIIMVVLLLFWMFRRARGH
jgi:hypothetical protein